MDSVHADIVAQLEGWARDMVILAYQLKQKPEDPCDLRLRDTWTITCPHCREQVLVERQWFQAHPEDNACRERGRTMTVFRRAAP